MNIVPCSENCRWQSEGTCTLNDLTRPAASAEAKCRYFEKAEHDSSGKS